MYVQTVTRRSDEEVMSQYMEEGVILGEDVASQPELPTLELGS